MKRLLVLGLLFAGGTPVGADPKVTLIKVPHGGLQPQALADAKGTIHLLYFKGEPAAGDLFYVRREAGKESFTTPLRINSQPASAIAVGTVRGGQFALGKAGRVHVVWNGSGKAKAKGGAPVLYSRLNDAGDAFEEQRDLRHDTEVLDGGCTVAADEAGNVLVAWHAVTTGDKGEGNRQVWVSHSRDDGKSFTKETPAWKEPTGVCGCCSMRAFGVNGSVHMLYRSATDEADRSIYLLSSSDKGRTFQGALVDRWKISHCPMSTMFFAAGPKGVVAAWDTAGRVLFSTVKPGTTEFTKPQSPPKAGKASKHPVIAFDDKGNMILVWTEGTAWMRGGAVAWQVYDASGTALEAGRRDGAIPVWGLPAVVPGGDGFIIFH